MARRIHIDFRKWPDTLHWQFEMEFLAEDEHGIWVWRAPGWQARRGNETPITARHTAVKLVTRDQWWTAIWNDEGPTTVYVDIILPARWSGDRVTMVDLDLDVVQRGDGEVEIHDEDEFAQHQVALGYSPAMIEGAVKATSAVVAALEAGDEPFANVWMERLAAARQLAGVDGG